MTATKRRSVGQAVAVPPYVDERMYLFLISPNNSGTTVISQYIAQRFDFYLPPFGNSEGQFAPAVKRMMRDRPWDETRAFDWPFIKTSWDALLRASGRDVFVEASPPNMLRLHEIRDAFGVTAHFIFSIADPYSFCGSFLFRYRERVDGNTLDEVAERWLFRAQKQAANIRDLPDAPRFTYETFCADPPVADRAVSRLLPHQARADRPIEFEGKASGYDGVVDLNIRNIAVFDFAEIERINERFDSRSELLAEFGYRLLTREDYDALRTRDPVQWAQGRERRLRLAPA